MTVPGNLSSPLLATAAAAGAAGGVATKSLRFNAADGSNLSKNFSSAGNTKTWTWSAWVKFNNNSGTQVILNSANGNNFHSLYLNSNAKLKWDDVIGGSDVQINLIPDLLIRDFSAWYHIVLAVDTTQSTAADRNKMYINGVQVTYESGNNFSQNDNSQFNQGSAFTVNIGSGYNASYSSVYLADIHFIDGSQLAPTSFGAYDDNGVWQAAAYSGTFGTNGFHLLDFANESTIGHDSSGNDNDFLANNLIFEDPTPLPSVLFDGSGDYLSFADSSDFDLVSSGTGDFTIEFFIKRTASASMYVLASGTDSTRLYINTGSGRIHLNNPTDSILMESSAAYTAYNNATGWVHIAFVKSSSTGYIFVNGTSQPQHGPAFTLSGDLDFNNLTISRDSTGVQGYISNLRIVKGSALYTSNFATPNAPLSNVTNTKLLCCQSSSSTTAATVTPGTITANGDVAASSVAANSTGANDVLFDVPTNGTQSDTGAGGEVSGNYCVFNPLDANSQASFANGNLDWTATSGNGCCRGTIAVSSGKWYFEFLFNSGGGTAFGILDVTENKDFIGGANAPKGYSYYSEGANFTRKYHNGTNANYGASFAPGDVIGVALDMDGGTITFYKNGSSQGQAYSGVSGTFAPAVSFGSSVGSASATLNAGQRAFAYSAPSGFSPLCTTLLPTPTIAKGSDYFNTALYTGNDSTRSITGVGHNPDLVWIKTRSQANDHVWVDSVRGVGVRLFSNSTIAESTQAASVTSFDSDGFSLGSHSSVNQNNVTHVAWCWDAGSSTVSNTDGSITSQVRANQTAGFSIVTYSATGSNLTVGHGLNAQPAMIWLKTRNSTGDWLVMHESIGVDHFLKLNLTQAKAGPYTNVFTSVSSSTFGTGNDSGINSSGQNKVAYCFAPVAGYSAFGSYTGSTSLPFVHCGFRPAFIILKKHDGGDKWCMYDTARGTFNTLQTQLHPNTADAESGAAFNFDILSNGFRPMDTSGQVNENGKNYIFYAVAENPFQANGGLAR